MSARKVCTTWRRICKYPAMWKVIKMLRRPGWDWDFSLEALTKEAVDLSYGELIDISIDGFGTDELLDHILLRITYSALSLAVKSLPQLEELHLIDTCINAQDLEVIGRNCPQLKFFKMSKEFSGRNDNHALAIVNNMPQLRHLGLFDSEITNNGLQAILNGCPHLHSLDVRRCCKLDFDWNFGNLGMKSIKDSKHGGFYYVKEFSEGDTYDEFYSVGDVSEDDF